MLSSTSLPADKEKFAQLSPSVQYLYKTLNPNAPESLLSNPCTDFSNITIEVLMQGLKNQTNKNTRVIPPAFHLTELIAELVRLDQNGKTYEVLQQFYSQVRNEIKGKPDWKVTFQDGSSLAVDQYIDEILPNAVISQFVASRTNSSHFSLAQKLTTIMMRLPFRAIHPNQLKQCIQDAFLTLGAPGKVLAKIVDKNLKDALGLVGNEKFCATAIKNYVNSMQVKEEDDIETLMRNYDDIDALAELLTLVDSKTSRPIYSGHDEVFTSTLTLFRTKALQIVQRIGGLATFTFDNITLKRLIEIVEKLRNSGKHPLFALQVDWFTKTFAQTKMIDYVEVERIIDSLSYKIFSATMAEDIAAIDKILKRTANDPQRFFRLFLKRGIALLRSSDLTLDEACDNLNSAISMANLQMVSLQSERAKENCYEVISTAHLYLARANEKLQNLSEAWNNYAKFVAYYNMIKIIEFNLDNEVVVYFLRSFLINHYANSQQKMIEEIEKLELPHQRAIIEFILKTPGVKPDEIISLKVKAELEEKLQAMKQSRVAVASAANRLSPAAVQKSAEPVMSHLSVSDSKVDDKQPAAVVTVVAPSVVAAPIVTVASPIVAAPIDRVVPSVVAPAVSLSTFIIEDYQPAKPAAVTAVSADVAVVGAGAENTVAPSLQVATNPESDFVMVSKSKVNDIIYEAFLNVHDPKWSKVGRHYYNKFMAAKPIPPKYNLMSLFSKNQQPTETVPDLLKAMCFLALGQVFDINGGERNTSEVLYKQLKEKYQAKLKNNLDMQEKYGDFIMKLDGLLSETSSINLHALKRKYPKIHGMSLLKAALMNAKNANLHLILYQKKTFGDLLFEVDDEAIKNCLEREATRHGDHLRKDFVAKFISLIEKKCNEVVAMGNSRRHIAKTVAPVSSPQSAPQVKKTDQTVKPGASAIQELSFLNVQQLMENLPTILKAIPDEMVEQELSALESEEETSALENGPQLEADHPVPSVSRVKMLG